MKPQCIEAIAKAVGRELSDKELTGIEERISRHLKQNAARDPEGTLGRSAEERLVAAAKGASEEFLADQAKKAQRVALQVLATAKLEQYLAPYGPNKFDGIDRMIAFHADTKGNFLSIESQAKAIEADSLRQMTTAMEAANPEYFGLFDNVEGIKALTKELFGEDSGNAAAKKGAAEFKKISETLRQRFNRAGGDVGFREDWGMPHHHGQMQVAAAGKQQWIADVLPKLDRKSYTNRDGSRMTDAEVAQFLGHAWETIATGGANKLEPGQFRGNGMRANRGSESRQINFRDADAYLEYQDKYANYSAYDVVIRHIQGISKDIALVETLGPNPDHTMRMLTDTAVREATLRDPVSAGKAQEAAINTENLYNQVAGKSLPVASKHLAQSFDTLRAWLVASRLGSAAITSITDMATVFQTAHVNKLPALKLFANELSVLNPANRMEKRMAIRAGLSMNSMIDGVNRFGYEALGASFSSKLAGATLRVSGLTAWTEANRRAFGVTMMSSIGQVTKDFDSFAKISFDDMRLLKSKGITEGDFAIWKLAKLEDWGGGNKTMLTPESIYRIPDDKLLGLGKDLFPDMTINAQALKERAATRLLGVVLEESNMAVIEPGAKERALMQSHQQRGTWKGEITKSFFLFKSFPISMITRHMARAMDQETAGGKAAYIAALIAGTTIFGAAALQINEVVSGRDPRNLNPFEEHGGKNWMAAMLKGGSLGLYGDFLFSEQSKYGGSAFATLLGPVAGLGEDVLNLTHGNLMQAAEGKDTNAGAEMVRFAKSNLPGANLWYTKAALDHLIFHNVQEYFSPGYLAGMESRARKQGQAYWWEPGETSPDRAPDLEAMVGE